MAKDFDTINLKVKFCITKAAGPDVASQKAAILKTAAWIAEAEKLFVRKPRLKITPAYKLDTVNVPTTFKNVKEADKFLKDHYDNIVGDSKTEGALVVAVAASGSTLTNDPDKSCDDEAFGGLSFYPDSVKPFGIKHGIALNVNKADGSFAHELGHMFGLIHTFEKERGVNKKCNKDFPQKKYGTRKGNTVNLMDHGLEDGDALWLNECQKEKAADHRRRLLTKDGKTNYKEL